MRKSSHSLFVTKVEDRFGKDLFEFPEEYKGRHEKIMIKHIQCGTSKPQTPHSLLKSRYGCKKCGVENRSADRTTPVDVFIKELENMYGDEYTLFDINSYKTYREHCLIKHKTCGEISPQAPEVLLKGHGCRKCSFKVSASKQSWGIDGFKEKVFNLVGNEYEVVGEYKGALNHLDMRHNICNNTYPVSPSKFVNSGNRCPYCNESHGEISIRTFLDRHQISYVRQYRIDECRHKHALPFDFAIIDNEGNLIRLIEFDGEQHFKRFRWEKDDTELNLRKHRDKIKDEYCKKNGIELIRIKYTDYDNIETILEEALGLVIA